MLYIHIHLYTYTHNTYIYIYTQYFTFIYGLLSKDLEYFLTHQSLTKLCEGGSFSFTDCRTEAYSRQVPVVRFCLFLLST